METVKGMRLCLLLVFLCIWAYGCPFPYIDFSPPPINPEHLASQEKRDFVENFDRINILRREAGLPPLDLCTEKYNFDKYWAILDPECKDKIKEFDK